MPTTLSPVRSLRFRDGVRLTFDRQFRELFMAMAREFDVPPNRSWYELRRDPEKSERWWGGLLRHCDEAVRAGVSEEMIMQVPEVMTAYIRTRLAERDCTPPVGGMRAIADEQLRRVA